MDVVHSALLHCEHALRTHRCSLAAGVRAEWGRSARVLAIFARRCDLDSRRRARTRRRIASRLYMLYVRCVRACTRKDRERVAAVAAMATAANVRLQPSTVVDASSRLDGSSACATSPPSALGMIVVVVVAFICSLCVVGCAFIAARAVCRCGGDGFMCSRVWCVCVRCATTRHKWMAAAALRKFECDGIIPFGSRSCGRRRRRRVDAAALPEVRAVRPSFSHCTTML